MRSLLCLALAALLAAATAAAAEVTIEKTDDGATVTIDGKLFTRYLTKSGNKPVLWPVLAPDGQTITRGFPIEPQPGETTDHVHQRGVWFTHGDVNGAMLWSQEPGSGEIRHREFLKIESGPVGAISSLNEWRDKNGKQLCTEEQTYRFSADGDVRIIDADLTLKATDGQLKLGDNKEGAFGIRVADSMRSEIKNGGQIVNSEDLTNESAWGQPARWVDYHGPVDGKVVGVAILDHPSNPSHPVRWHVRPYGLFAVNPFARHAFDPGKPRSEVVAPAGESIRFRYRVIIHRGDESEGKIAQHWDEFAKQ